jgi:hypothetical protein
MEGHLIMSNQGWSRPASKDKSVGEKIYDVVTWPLRAVLRGLGRLILRKR